MKHPVTCDTCEVKALHPTWCGWNDRYCDYGETEDSREPSAGPEISDGRGLPDMQVKKL